jgi:excisionase family DNA binding protein
MNELYSVHEAAKLLKLSESTVYRSVESGIFPHLRMGQNIRFSEADISTFLSRKTRNAERDRAQRRAQKIKTLYKFRMPSV